ncbi:hypothetical protein HNP84_009164 [Thermocatellispora tengchongensis]|uniref:Gram-positive cocci surface proteins LPxTG domain-containing protein n=1 Tax=Thermocatellispora tengchongensis TaxID=1073253 RepID=A0A840PNP9_9ACTN|nr:hypothetical protein [Thermocatellispora tengchongensis]MBB5139401.1 hypothetical protein [Thermocatellispora tengchongensis]
MSRVRHVAALGAIVVFGVASCSAEANTTPPEATPTPTATASPGTTASVPGRQAIKVTLDPERVTAGESTSVWVLANCPVPTNGPSLSGTARSNAFTRAVTLDPLPPNVSTASPNPTGTPSPLPWVRGEATVRRTARAGTYDVNVTCEGTNDTGRARLRIVAASTVVPTRAPRAGGGGTAAGGPEEESGLPIGTTGLVLLLALGGGVALAVRRRRS